MSYPSLSEYNKTILKEGGHAFTSLHNLRFLPSQTTPFKVMHYGVGAFAVVYKAEKEDIAGQFAIRCFLNAEEDKLDRYKKISSYLNAVKSPWKVKFELLENEVQVSGLKYPVLKMNWVHGISLHEFVSNNLHNNPILSQLQEKLVSLGEDLEKNKIGHGDLQSGNIIVKTAGQGFQLKLIDYDGMYIPTITNSKSLEKGRPEYQHPKRTAEDFNEKIDRFSIWVMLTAIQAIQENKDLWKNETNGGFNTQENFLFKGDDFKSPNTSRLFQHLLFSDLTTQGYAQKLKSFSLGDVDKVAKPELLRPSIPQNNAHIKPKPVPSQKEEISILTSPAGINVFNAAYQKIGATPLKIDKEKYLTKSIFLLYESTMHEIKITVGTKIYDHAFKSLKQPSVPPAPTTTAQPPIDDNPIDWLIGSVLALAIVFIIVVASFRSSRYNDTSSSYTPTNPPANLVSPVNTQENSESSPVKEQNQPSLSGLKEYKRQYPVDVHLFDNPALSMRLKSLLGADYGDFRKYWQVETPLVLEDEVLSAIGCEQHNCGDNEYILLIDLQNDNINVYHVGAGIKSYEEKGLITLPTDLAKVLRTIQERISRDKLSISPIEAIKGLTNAEDRRDFEAIYSYFSPNMYRYWDLSYPSKEQLQNRYRHSWQITRSSDQEITNISKIDNYTYDMYCKFEYITREKGNYKEVNSIVRFVFDSNGKILETYGL